MKIFLAWCCVAIALGMIALLIASAKDCKQSADGLFDFLFSWLCDSSEVLGILFISIVGAFILFVRANK